MKRYIALLLLLCFHAQPIMVASVWVDFCVNNDYIREVLCINKTKPEMNCDGKCFLATKLKQETQQKESNNKMILGEFSATPVFFVSYKDVTFGTVEISSANKIFFFANKYKLLPSNKKNRPPITV